MTIRHSLARGLPFLCAALALLWVGRSQAETGYDLWLRYALVENAPLRHAYQHTVSSIVVQGDSPTSQIIRSELERGLTGMLGAPVPISDAVRDGALMVGTPESSKLIASLGWGDALAREGKEGFVIHSTWIGRRAVTVIASVGEAGALHGAFHFLRLLQTQRPITRLHVAQRPKIELRVLDHWDNLNGSIERGYAGQSLWNWAELPDRVDPRIQDYGRANASIGINGAVLNNVNATPLILGTDYLQKVAALADTLRPYGIRVYLSANFASPMVLGGLPTADPLDPAVLPWWRDKVAEIYRLIPDFGGFLVKANSEGQPGPLDYGRTHADGANLLADALAPYGGVVMYRAFVYNANVDPDRVKRAYLELTPFDGQFRDNVLIQAKNGPLDFQPREPFHPLFGGMPQTPVMAELQVTQEYLGQGNHLVYLGTMWEEVLDAETFTHGTGSTVARVIDGSVFGYRRTGIAGVANTGTATNWTNHHFHQANWYAYGRLAWNPSLGAATIADEWIRMTWSQTPETVATIRSIMLPSREVYLNYTMPLGLHHLIGGDHYAPMPENDDPDHPDWRATTYHRADTYGIGYDRTRETGSGFVDQYHSPLNDLFDNLAFCPDQYLLWFHHLPWDYQMRSGRTLWDEMVLYYYRGADGARWLLQRWQTLQGKVDDERYQAVLDKLQLQSTEAVTWRDHILNYFQTFSQRPIVPPLPIIP